MSSNKLQNNLNYKRELKQILQLNNLLNHKSGLWVATYLAWGGLEVFLKSSI